MIFFDWLWFNIGLVRFGLELYQSFWFFSWQMLWCLPFSVLGAFRVSSKLNLVESEDFSHSILWICIRPQTPFSLPAYQLRAWPNLVPLHKTTKTFSSLEKIWSSCFLSCWSECFLGASFYRTLNNGHLVTKEHFSDILSELIPFDQWFIHMMTIILKICFAVL